MTLRKPYRNQNFEATIACPLGGKCGTVACYGERASKKDSDLEKQNGLSGVYTAGFGKIIVHYYFGLKNPSAGGLLMVSN